MAVRCATTNADGVKCGHGCGHMIGNLPRVLRS
ncbi:hypothetical protein COLO4_22485 [Corchorus olitorius]|uniref:Uncharacterized protein n=1 Tax=Corchorus olitorius TaxID=93759 RepID=A0A1R3ILH7_9ROSI|nr:hypothetical protein COLO4_22485 [Corchorus olitorius]